MKRFFIGVLIIVCVWFVKACNEAYVKSKMTEQQEYKNYNNINEQLKTLAKEFNQTLPIKIDETMELSRVEIHKDKEVRYCYTVLDNNVVFTSDEIKKYREIMQQVVRESTDFDKFKKLQVIMSYAYYNSKGDCLALIKIYPKDYQ
ncbi:hypothetical protein QVO10_06540 [Bacteroides gallinaceum]|uniref:Lipoprotein n=1 Tax=Bacteroides gallinaceum TaxID=1462571 RepID=A0ABT7X4M7_9BACE|nr:hypothetical protein [Bacteroides gallinaceum]MDN0049045.1 hypothetical protein [Bacteroides gallinaceum]